MASREARVTLDITGTREYRDLVAKLAATKRVLADREGELLALQGPCSLMTCRLHYTHSGPCDIREDMP
jgi:hypothetical protein